MKTLSLTVEESTLEEIERMRQRHGFKSIAEVVKLALELKKTVDEHQSAGRTRIVLENPANPSDDCVFLTGYPGAAQ